MKPRQARLREGTEGAGQLTEAIHSKRLCFRRCMCGQDDLRLEDMAADLRGSGLQVLLAVMKACQGVEDGPQLMRGLLGEKDQNPRRQPYIADTPHRSM